MYIESYVFRSNLCLQIVILPRQGHFFISQGRDGRFLVCKLFVNEQFRSVFFSHLKKLISFILKKFVQFISISFIFSVKSFVQKKTIVVLVQNATDFSFLRQMTKVVRLFIHEIFCSFSNISFVHKNDVNLYPRVDAYLWAMPNLRGYLRTIHIYFMGGGGDAMLIIYSIESKNLKNYSEVGKISIFLD